MKSSWELVQEEEDRMTNELIREENTQLKSDLQALRELLKEIEFSDDGCCLFCYEGSYEGHKDTCKLKAELDKIKAVE